MFHSEHSLDAQFTPGKHWYLFFYSLSYIFALFFPVAMSSAHRPKFKAFSESKPQKLGGRAQKK